MSSTKEFNNNSSDIRNFSSLKDMERLQDVKIKSFQEKILAERGMAQGQEKSLESIKQSIKQSIKVCNAVIKESIDGLKNTLAANPKATISRQETRDGRLYNVTYGLKNEEIQILEIQSCEHSAKKDGQQTDSQDQTSNKQSQSWVDRTRLDKQNNTLSSFVENLLAEREGCSDEQAKYRG